MDIVKEIPESVWWWVFGASLALAVVSPLIVGALLVWMPTDFFVRSPGQRNSDGRLVVRLVLKTLKNLLGVILFLAGVVMLATPGQGLLAMLVGISLLDVPGKRRVEQYLARLPRVYRAVNALRRRFGRPPYELPNDDRRAAAR